MPWMLLAPTGAPVTEQHKWVLVRFSAAASTRVVPREPFSSLDFPRREGLFLCIGNAFLGRRSPEVEERLQGMSVIDDIKSLHANTLAAIGNVPNTDALEKIRVEVVGKSGTLTGYLRAMGQVAKEHRAEVGKTVNAARNEIEAALEAKKRELAHAELEARMEADAIDITLPGRSQQMGTRHLINAISDEISEIFLGLGYTVATGPEVETDWYNFTALNAPADHPSRSMQDTFYVRDLSGEKANVRGESDVLLRTQTSGVQVHVMEDQELPIYIIAPGKVYRRDVADPSHLPQFTQCEGLVVDKGITFGDLKGTLEYFCKQMFGPDRKTRFRAHFFPFTEPSAEADVSCGVCGGTGHLTASVAACARARAGLRFWAAAWWTRTFCACRASTPRCTPASPSA